MKKSLLLLLLASFVATSVVQPMKRQREDRDEPGAKRLALDLGTLPACTLDGMPQDILGQILVLVMGDIDTDNPWNAIKKIGHFQVACKKFCNLLQSGEFIASLINIPQIHICALMGDWAKVIDLKINNNNRPDRCIQAWDRFKKTPEDYAKAGGHADKKEIGIFPESRRFPAYGVLIGNKVVTCEQCSSFEMQRLLEDSLACFLKNNAYVVDKFVANLDDLLVLGGNVNFSVNTRVNDKLVLIHYVALYGKTNFLKILCEKVPIVVNVCDALGYNPLYLAIQEGELFCVRELLKHEKIDVNIHNGSRNTPLYFAVKEGQLACVQELLRHEKIDVNIPNIAQDTPLHVAAEEGQLTCLQELLKHEKIDVNIKNGNGNTPLHFAVWDGQLACLQELLNHKKIDVNTKNDIGNTPLRIAVEQGQLTCLQELLNHKKIDVNIKNNNGSTPLHIAAKKEQLTCLQKLLNHNDIQVNAQDKNGYTPLHCAACYGQVDCLKLLLDHGADTSIEGRGVQGTTALDVAQKAGEQEIVDLLQ